MVCTSFRASSLSPAVVTMNFSPVSTKPNRSPIHHIIFAVRLAMFLTLNVKLSAIPLVGMSLLANGVSLHVAVTFSATRSAILPSAFSVPKLSATKPLLDQLLPFTFTSIMLPSEQVALILLSMSSLLLPAKFNL